MKIAYFDCAAGISGDMVLGALVDAGLPLEALKAELDKLGVPEFELSARKVRKHGISATKVDVAAREGHVHRGLEDVLSIIRASGVSGRAKERASAIFRRLAEAEAQVHGVSVDRVHFHEVGAVDAIVDVVGAVVGLDLLDVEEVYASVLRLGRGVTQGSHGAMPVPVPAVVALCQGFPTERSDIPFELVTPTGAAILTTLAAGIGQPVVLRTRRIGYGAGSRDLEQAPNLLRIEIGERAAPHQADALTLIETSIDDMTPEIYGYLVESLLSQGARDAYLTPTIMKKGRPGILLSVLADPARVDALTDLIFSETTTLGVRLTRVDRLKLPRREEVVETPFGPIRIKVVEHAGRTRIAPEYEDCARIARERGIPILDVYRTVANACEEQGRYA